MVTVMLALGGNLGNRALNLRWAVSELSARLEVTAVSSLYETAPMYVLDQPPFLNMALAATTKMLPLELLACVKALELELGRLPGLRFGPRLVDIDLLFYGDKVTKLPDLEIPHPRLAERVFVLAPLAEIASNLRHPVLGFTIAELLARLTGDDRTGDDGVCRRITLLSPPHDL